MKSLATASEKEGVSSGNLPAILLMLSDSDDPRFSGMLLNPVKSPLTASESVGASDANLPADLLMLSISVPIESGRLLNP